MSDVRCQVCDVTIGLPESGGLSACPSCDTKLLPVSPAHDVTVTINWHTLRGFVIWAEFWAEQARNKSETNADMLKLVYTQARRLEQQHPELPSLTFGSDLAALRAAYPKTEVHGFDETAFEGSQASGEAERIIGSKERER